MNNVTLIPGNMIMSQNLDMPIFQNIDWNLGQMSFKNGKEGIRMAIVMKRKITSEMIADIYISTSMETFEHRKYKIRGENGNN